MRLGATLGASCQGISVFSLVNHRLIASIRLCSAQSSGCRLGPNAATLQSVCNQPSFANAELASWPALLFGAREAAFFKYSVELLLSFSLP